VEVASVHPTSAIKLRSKGDLEGTAECELVESKGKTIITISWHVSTTKPWMNFFGPVLSPLFVLNHHAVMRSGERGLNRYLSSDKN
jgi:hypothetical protein